jgi:hypothetical protein
MENDAREGEAKLDEFVAMKGVFITAPPKVAL